MPKKNIFTKDQIEWIRQQLDIYAPYELLPIINEKYNMNMTVKQFKSWRHNHKVTGSVRKNPHKGQYMFSPEIVAFIDQHKNEYEAPYMAKLIKENFGKEYTARQIKNFKVNHGYTGTLTGANNKYRPNPHKGQKGWCVPNSESTRFKNDERSWATAPLLTIRKRPAIGNYLFIKIAEPNVWINYARYVWEQANGPLKEGEKIKFLDGNKENCALENLMIIDNQVQGKCHALGRYSDNAELTKAGILLSKIELKVEGKK